MASSSETIKQALSAIDVLVKDVDKKFDECLVERFIETMSSEIRVPATDWNESTMIIFDRIKYYMDLDSFVMLNQARAYKTFRGALRTQILTENRINLIEPHLQSFWNNMGMVVINDNLDAMTVILSIMENLTNTTSGLRWLITQKIQAPLKLLNNQINDAVSLTSHYIETCKNHHTKHMAEKLLRSLIINSIRFQEYLPSDLPIREIIRGLMLKCSETTVYILNDILENSSAYNIDEDSIMQQYDIQNLLEQCFNKAIEQTGPTMYNFCKCMAYMTDTQASFDKSLSLLKTKNRLDGMVVYLTNSALRHEEHSQLYANFVLYPILTSCKNEEADLIIQELLTTRDGRDFVDKYCSEKLITLILVQLSQSLVAKKKNNYEGDLYLNNRLLILTVQTLTCYIEFHVSRQANNKHLHKSFRNLMEACNGLNHLLSQPSMNSKTNICQLIRNLLTIMTSTHPITNSTKPVFMSLIRVLQSAHIRFMSLSNDDSMLKEYDLFDKTLELASKSNDHDILNEFMQLFIASRFVIGVRDKVKYLNFIWNHVYPSCRETEHQEIIGNLFVLMLEADMNIENEALEKLSLARHGIAKLVGDWLVEYSAVSPTVQLIVTNLYANVRYIDHLTGGPDKDSCKFCLDSPIGLEDAIDKLAQGLCITLKGDASDGSQLASGCLLERFIISLIKNEQNPNILFKRLLQTTILETLYDVATGSSFGGALKMMAARKVLSIKGTVLDKIEKGYDRLHLEMNAMFEANESNNHKVLKREKAHIVSEYYKQASEELLLDDQSEEVGEKLADGLSQTAKDILNFELLADGILDCY